MHKDHVSPFPANADKKTFQVSSLVEKINALVKNEGAEENTEQIDKKVGVGISPTVPIVNGFHG